MSGRVLPLHRSKLIARKVRGLRMSPILAAVGERQKVRVILDFTVGHGVSTDTDFDETLLCDLGNFLFNVSRTRALVENKIARDYPFTFLKKDVKDAFRRVHIEWD